MELDSIQQAAQQQFGSRSRQYGSGHILADVSDVQDALKGIDLPEQADIIDIATGAGHTGVYLASLGHDVTLTDLAEPMLERVRELAAERGVKVHTRQHAAEELPYPDNSFDLVTCRVAAHHFTSPARFVAEAARVLRPGGLLLVIDGSVPDDSPEAEEWLHQVEKLRDPSHNRLLSPKAWIRLCEGAGLAVARAELQPLKQPDLDWYFDAAATPEPSRRKVRQLVETAPASAREAFQIGSEQDKTIWWWPRLTLVARSVEY